jgi:hypothetical protein
MAQADIFVCGSHVNLGESLDRCNPCESPDVFLYVMNYEFLRVTRN